MYVCKDVHIFNIQVKQVTDLILDGSGRVLEPDGLGGQVAASLNSGHLEAHLGEGEGYG